MRYLNYLDTTVGFDVAAAAEEDFEPVLGFFRHSLSDSPHREPRFVFAVTPRGDALPDPRRSEEVAIRRSSAPEFTFVARRVRESESVLYSNENATVRLPRVLSEARNRIEVGVTGGAVVQMVDLVRDLVTRNEEALGTIILHASGVTYGEEVVAIAGSKGAGKTTMLLRLLAGEEVSYFTGDKLFCRVSDGCLRALPWRDWPYVGVGTLRASPWLGEFAAAGLAADLDALPAGQKLLLDPDRFERVLGVRFEVEERPVGTVLLPRVDPDRPVGIGAITDPGERLARILQLIDRSCDTSYFAWQSLLVPDYGAVYANVAAARETLAALRMVSVEGDLKVGVGDVVGAR